MPSVSRWRPMPSHARWSFSSASSNSASVGSRRGSWPASVAPRCEPTSTKKPLRSSVRARSNPSVAAGPVPHEAQKHVPPGRVQLTVNSNACCRAWVYQVSDSQRKACGRSTPKTRSCTRMAANSQGRTPRRPAWAAAASLRRARSRPSRHERPAAADGAGRGGLSARRPHHVFERQSRVAGDEPVAAAVLVVAEALGKLVGGRDGLERDGLIHHRWGETV